MSADPVSGLPAGSSVAPAGGSPGDASAVSRTTSSTASSEFVCPSCATISNGRFCTHCGEKRLGDDDRSLRRIADGVVNFLTHLDSKGYRSLWYLIRRPGFLSQEYLRGSRVRYGKPLALFISLNVIYYLSIALVGANTFSTPLDVQLHQNDYYPAFAQREVEQHLARSGLTATTLEARYNEKAGVLSKTLVFLFIPIYAVIFYALFFRRRPFFVEHVVVATHFWSFVLVLLSVVVPAIAWLLVWWHHATDAPSMLAAFDGPLSAFLQACVGVYMAFMFRRVYRLNWPLAVVTSSLLAWSFFHLVWLYRFLLFIVTLNLATRWY